MKHRNPAGSVEEGNLVLLCFGCGHFNHTKLGKNKETESWKPLERCSVLSVVALGHGSILVVGWTIKTEVRASDYICHYLEVGVIKISVNFNLLHLLGKHASRRHEEKTQNKTLDRSEI